MASTTLRVNEPVSVPYRRFSGLIIVSVIAHYVYAAAYVALGQGVIAAMLALPATVVLGLFPLMRTGWPAPRIRLFSHAALVINFAGLVVALMWMGLDPKVAVWWLVWWPMLVAHLLGARDAAGWVALALASAVLIWLNASQGWVAPRMAAEHNPVFVMQLGFLVIGVAVGAVVRRAHDRYQHDIQLQQATIREQKQSLERRTEDLEDMLQAVQQSNMDRIRMFAQISHEFRTPLNGMLGFTQLLQRTPLNDQQQHYSHQLQACGETLLQIVNDVLQFSRMEAQHLAPLTRAPYDAVRTAREAVDMLAPQADQKGIVLHCEFDAPALPAVGDALRVKQVLLNLVANAVKFTDAQGRVSVRGRAVQTDDGRQALRVEVQDTGIGIPEDLVPHLFQPFNRASERTIRDYGGTGLGLAICKRLVDMMDGAIGVSSEPGQGSLFWFEVPVGETVAINP